MNNISERQQIEKDYHNKMAKNTVNFSNNTEPGLAYEYFWNRIGNVSGLNILDFGCGDGWVSILLAKNGAAVTGIDISEELIFKARASATRENLQEFISFYIMAGEDVNFKENSFDLVIGSAILHHTEINFSIKSIYKVLKSGGRALFIEPLNQNLFLKLWRLLTPSRRSPTERALTSKDLAMICEIFPNCEMHFFQLASIFTEGLTIFFPKIKFLRKINVIVEKLDTRIVSKFPSLGKYCAVVVLELRK